MLWTRAAGCKRRQAAKPALAVSRGRQQGRNKTDASRTAGGGQPWGDANRQANADTRVYMEG